MSRKTRAALGVFLSFLFLCSCLILPSSAERQMVTVLDGEPNRNVGANDYGSRWASPVKSYLTVGEDGGYIRAFARKLSTYSAYSAEDDVLVVEWYTGDGKLIKSKTQNFLLPLFGGFHFGEKYNYALFGQFNGEDDPEKVVFLLAQYDKEMNLLKTTELKGANTYSPFAAGTCRFTETGGKLYVFTCHEMFKSHDGLHHQANVILVYDAATAELLDGHYAGGYVGYASHSFNQFIVTDGVTVFRADHGDAYPRGVQLSSVRVDGQTGLSEREMTAMEFVGEIGANATGATLGGMALVDDRVLVAGSIDDQTVEYGKSDWTDDRQKNIFVLSVDKSLDKATVVRRDVTKFTNDSGVKVGNPHLVQLDTGALLLWEETMEKTRVKALRLDKTGAPAGEIYTYDLRLSDCLPVVDADGTVIWIVSDEERSINGYGTFDVVTDGTNLKLCRIDPNDLSWGAVSDHGWMVTKVLAESTCEDAGRAEYLCVICGKTKTDVMPPLGHDWGRYTLPKEDSICWHVRICNRDPAHVEQEAHNWIPQSVTVPATATENGTAVFRCGICESSFTGPFLPPTQGPGMELGSIHVRYTDETHTAVVFEPHVLGEWTTVTAPTCVDEGEKAAVCLYCPYEERDTIPATGEHKWGAWTVTTPAAAEKEGEETRVCSVCGSEETRVLPKLPPEEPVSPDVMLGDVNGDGRITSADARLALRRAVDLETYPEGSREFIAADVDKSGTVTAADARRILRAAVQLEDPSEW